MPAQPLLPARRPRALSIADPPVAAETQAEVVPSVTPVEVLTQETRCRSRKWARSSESRLRLMLRPRPTPPAQTRRPPLQCLSRDGPPSSRPKAVLNSAPSAVTRVHLLWKGTFSQKGQQWHLQDGRLSDDHSRSAVINCLITSHYLGTGNSNLKGPI